jgi:hypothetical protein
MKSLLVSALMLSFSAFAAENCLITVPAETPVKIQTNLSKRGYTLTSKSAATYELVFDEFTARPIFEKGGYRALGVDDQLISLNGSVIMKVNKFMPNGKKDLQFAIKSAGSVSTCAGTCIKSLREGKEKLYFQLINSDKLAVSVPTCRALY